MYNVYAYNSPPFRHSRGEQTFITRAGLTTSLLLYPFDIRYAIHNIIYINIFTRVFSTSDYEIENVNCSLGIKS